MSRTWVRTVGTGRSFPALSALGLFAL